MSVARDDPGAAPLPVLVLELRRDGTIERHDGRGIEAFEVPEGSRGRKVGDVMPASHVGLVQSAIEHALDRGRCLLQSYAIGRGSTARSFEASTIPIGPDRVIRVVTETTRQRHWWRDLQASEARFRQLFEQALDGIFVYDEFGRLLDVSPRACAAIGYTREELLGTSFPDLFPAITPSQLMQLSRRLRPPSTATISAMQRHEDGSMIPVELRMGRMAVEGPARYLAVVRDVTDRRNVERVALDAAEEEQRRIGRDLHDGLGQHLAGLSFMAKALERALSAHDHPQAEAAAEIRRLVEQALGHSRALAHGLAPVDVHGTELIPALQRLAQDTASLCGIECRFVADGDPSIRDEATATALYRIAQEAVTNALRHAEASRIDIALADGDDGIALVVRDDGRGQPSAVAPARRGRGLGQRLMAMRAERIGGTLDIAAVPGRGTTVRCIVHRTVAVDLAAPIGARVFGISSR